MYLHCNIFTQLLNDIVRDRASRTLTYNDEQFHILEKIKMQETIRVLVDLLQKECAPVVAQGRTDAPLLFLISNCREISSDQSLKVGFSVPWVLGCCHDSESFSGIVTKWGFRDSFSNLWCTL